MSANPSIAEGLDVCTEADLERETAFSEAGSGCPNASKIGSVEVETPLLERKAAERRPLHRQALREPLQLAARHVHRDQNREPGDLGQAAASKVEPDPVTGQLTTVAEELPQLPFSHFRLHFREGARSPLTTPQACGTYNAEATLYPWSGKAPITTNSAFQIITGPNEGPCPTGGLPPFKPGLVAGTINNRAGSFSPFNLRLFRSDAEQEFTHFSIKLPPGITGKLAGIPYCSDAAIAAAKARTGPHGGQEELNSPSCPAASEIGSTLAGAGVGPALTYAPGKVYLAGPYHGSNLSMVAITAGKVGPFDIGTVVIRQAFKIDPETAEVFIDSTGSDPIPHIIRGIPVHLRDIRAYVDKPEFVLNPTDCTATSTASTVLGSGLDFVSEADDNPITVTSPLPGRRLRRSLLQAAAFDAASRRHPPRRLPQLQCPPGDERDRRIGDPKRPGHPAQVRVHRQRPLRHDLHPGAVQRRGGQRGKLPSRKYLWPRQSGHPDPGRTLGRPRLPPRQRRRTKPPRPRRRPAQLPGRLRPGRLRRLGQGTAQKHLPAAPDAPVSSFDIELEGGSKGLFENSVNLCAKKHFAAVGFVGQNGKAYSAKPVLKVKCPKKHKRHAKRHHKRHAGR